MPPSPFRLGRWGVAINGVAVLSLSFIFVMLFFPTAPHPDAGGMNWTIVIYSVVLVGCIAYYYLGNGRDNYTGPVEKVEKDA